MADISYLNFSDEIYEQQLSANMPTIVFAKYEISFIDAGFTPSNLVRITRLFGNAISYDPNRSINGITHFEVGPGYYIRTKTDLDLSHIIS